MTVLQLDPRKRKIPSVTVRELIKRLQGLDPNTLVFGGVYPCYKKRLDFEEVTVWDSGNSTSVGYRATSTLEHHERENERRDSNGDIAREGIVIR